MCTAKRPCQAIATVDLLRGKHLLCTHDSDSVHCTCSSSSDQQTANTSGHYRSAAIGLPGFARVTGRSGADSLVLSQTPGQAKNSSKGSGSSSSSSSDTRGAGSSVRDAAAAPTPVRQDNIGEYSTCNDGACGALPRP